MAFTEGVQMLIETAERYTVTERPARALLLCAVAFTFGRFLWKVGVMVSQC